MAAVQIWNCLPSSTTGDETSYSSRRRATGSTFPDFFVVCCSFDFQFGTAIRRLYVLSLPVRRNLCGFASGRPVDFRIAHCGVPRTPNMSGKFTNQVVLIFGGSSGIGKATAAIVFREGGTPWLIGRNEAKLQAARKEISPDAPERIPVTSVDVLSDESLKAFFAALPVGSFHHMVLTVGESSNCVDITGDEGFSGLRKQFDLKFFAQIAPISYGVERLSDGGSIVLTSGILSRRPGIGSTALSAANAALEAVVKGLANDFGPRVRINCVSPGLTNTEMWSYLSEDKRNNMLHKFAEKVPLRRVGESRDVAEAICYLLSSSYTTGTTLDIDGGAVVRK